MGRVVSRKRYRNIKYSTYAWESQKSKQKVKLPTVLQWELNINSDNIDSWLLSS